MVPYRALFVAGRQVRGGFHGQLRWETEGRRGSDAYTVELRFEGERLRIAYRGIDRGDGRGPHDEELELAPGDILAVRFEARGRRLVVEHAARRSVGTVEEGALEQPYGAAEEELPLGDDGDRSILVLDRFAEYLREYGIGGDSADDLSAYSAAFKQTLSLEERDRALAAGRPYIDGMSDMVELPCDEAKRKGLRRPQRVRQVIYLVYVIAGLFGVVLVNWIIYYIEGMFGVVLMSWSDERWNVLAFIFYMISIVALGVCLFWHKSSAALWNQSVRIGPDRLMFHRWRGRQRADGRGKHNDDLYYNDTSRVPFCVSSITGYRADEEEVVVLGSFWDNYVESDEGRRSGTRHVDEFKIARTFSDGDELQLLACLDRLVPSGSSDAESFDAGLVGRGTGGLGSLDTGETDPGPFDAGSPA